MSCSSKQSRHDQCSYSPVLISCPLSAFRHAGASIPQRRIRSPAHRDVLTCSGSGHYRVGSLNTQQKHSMLLAAISGPSPDRAGVALEGSSESSSQCYRRSYSGLGCELRRPSPVWMSHRQGPGRQLPVTVATAACNSQAGEAESTFGKLWVRTCPGLMRGMAAVHPGQVRCTRPACDLTRTCQ